MGRMGGKVEMGEKKEFLTGKIGNGLNFRDRGYVYAAKVDVGGLKEI